MTEDNCYIAHAQIIFKPNSTEEKIVLENRVFYSPSEFDDFRFDINDLKEHEETDYRIDFYNSMHSCVDSVFFSKPNMRHLYAVPIEVIILQKRAQIITKELFARLIN